MFGRNVPIKPVYDDTGKLRIVSIFHTIQGEGPLAGEPAVFVRLAGCNLRCHFCDTDFETGAKEKEVETIFNEVDFIAPPTTALVVITGGEPLAQNLVPLVKRLSERFYVQLETAGTLWQKGLEAIVMEHGAQIVCSPKTGTAHPMIEKFCTDFKYIIRAGETDAKDGLPIKSTQEEGRALRLYRPPWLADAGADEAGTIWVQPCDEYDHPGGAMAHDVAKVKRNIEETTRVALAHGYRVSFQLHKVLGVE